MSPGGQPSGMGGFRSPFPLAPATPRCVPDGRNRHRIGTLKGQIETGEAVERFS